jgi:hypothetical protein
VKIAETYAADQAQIAWLEGGNARGHLAHYNLDFDDVAQWSQVGIAAVLEAALRNDGRAVRGRIVGIVAAALALGIELERSGELR